MSNLQNALEKIREAYAGFVVVNTRDTSTTQGVIFQESLLALAEGYVALSAEFAISKALAKTAPRFEVSQ